MAASWKRSTMSAQASGSFGSGTEPPPERMLPSFHVLIGEALASTWSRSVCVI